MEDTRGVVRLRMPCNDKPEPVDLQRFLTAYCNLWRGVGLHLNLNLSVLNEVEADHHAVKERFRVTLEKWLQLDDGVTWGNLELAITNANRENLNLQPLTTVPPIQPEVVILPPTEPEVVTVPPMQPVIQSNSYLIQDNNIRLENVKDAQRSDDSFTDVNFAGYKSVTDAFIKLTTIFADQLHGDNFDAIRMASLIPASRRLQNKFCRATSVYGLFDVLSRNPLYFNWMNVKYLQSLAAASNSKELQGILEQYTDAIFSKTLGEICDCLPTFYNTRTKYYSKVRAKFCGRNPNNVTVEELIKECKLRFIKKMALHIMKAEKGSLTVTWCILAEEAYQAYLLALAVPQECREDDFLQIGVWVAHHPQFVIQELKKVHTMMTTSTLLIGYYHGLLLKSIDADLLTDKMCSAELLTVQEQIVISSGHSVYQKNWLLLEHVQHMDVQALVTFCELLQEIWPQIGSQLILALKDKDVSVSDESHVGISKVEQDDAQVEDTDTASSVDILFLYLVDQIYELLQNYKLELVQLCKNLKASDVYDINLFSADQIKELSECNNILIKLSPLFTWSNHSILKSLAGCSSEAVKLLDEFGSKLDPLQPVTSYPIPCLCSNMIPTDTSTYTILAVRCDKELYQCTLQYVYDVQSVMTEKCDITQHCLQLLAMINDPTILYWIISKCVVDLINTNVPLHSEYLYSRGILEVLVYPDLLLTTGDDICYGSLTFDYTDQLFSEEVVDLAIASQREEYDAKTMLKHELEKTRIRSNLLEETNNELQSQLDVAHKQVKKLQMEKKKMAEKYQKLKMPTTSEDTLAFSDKSRKSYQSQDKYSSEINIHQLINIVPLIQEKWSLIGTRLKLSSYKLDEICHAVSEQGIPTESKNTFCCVKMLTSWYETSDDASVDAIIMAVDAPHVGLKSKISSIEAALKSEYVYDFDSSVGRSVATPPETLEQSYFDMITKFCLKLKRSLCSISDILVYLKVCKISPDVLEGINDFPELVRSLEKNKLLNRTDLSWLKAIAHHAHCEKATKYIEKYENLLMADKISWYSSHPKGAYIVGRTDKKPENVTIKDSSNAKSAVSKFVNIKISDSVLDYSEVGSVTFYWRLNNQGVRIQIPKVINASLVKECKNVGLTHVGIMTDGNLTIATVDEIANDARSLFGYSKLHLAASDGDDELLKSLLLDDFNINYVNGKTIDGGYTPLHLAASAGHVDCVKELLDCNKTDVHITDAFDRTPLETAEQSFKSDVAKLLRYYRIKLILVSPRSQWEKYICPGCDGLMNELVLTSCGHQICRECFDKIRKNSSYDGGPWCPVKDDHGQKHKMSWSGWSKDRTVTEKINKLLVKCDECKEECTVKKYKEFDCSTGHKGISSMLISPRLKWEEYICQACNELAEDPVLVSCGYFICHKCFNQLKLSSSHDSHPWCSDKSCSHKKMSQDQEGETAKWKINQLLVKCKKCKVECTVKRYRKSDCSTAHEVGINSILIMPRSQWEEYICPDCDELMDHPVKTSCGHYMCYKCFDERRRNNFYDNPWCPVRDDDGQRHKMSKHERRGDWAIEQKIDRLLVNCEKCDVECTVKGYRKSDCSTGHDEGFNSILISPRSQWEEYICPVCNDLMNDPIQTSCGHRMCYKCFDESDSQWCPVIDNDNGQKHKIKCGWTKDRSTERKINELLVKCKNCGVTCTVERYRDFSCSTEHETY